MPRVIAYIDGFNLYYAARKPLEAFLLARIFGRQVHFASPETRIRSTWSRDWKAASSSLHASGITKDDGKLGQPLNLRLELVKSGVYGSTQFNQHIYVHGRGGTWSHAIRKAFRYFSAAC